MESIAFTIGSIVKICFLTVFSIVAADSLFNPNKTLWHTAAYGVICTTLFLSIEFKRAWADFKKIWNSPSVLNQIKQASAIVKESTARLEQFGEGLEDMIPLAIQISTEQEAKAAMLSKLIEEAEGLADLPKEERIAKITQIQEKLSGLPGQSQN